ncbi:MAG TPA: sigma-70 family RNA polymerase sigma factor [Lachnospiraceae bacterium]|nr:sigma-70 family RNA polymerase sigma factor [Lachnospiraceae bacterium]
MDENKIIPYIEPIFRFCCKRLSNRYDAEDLASEIICHVLEGLKKFQIDSLDAWVWRVAHNRYARFIDAQSKTKMILAEDDIIIDAAGADYCLVDEESTVNEYETVFRYLHTLSAEYRNIFVDYYIGDMSIRMLSKKYSLPETTIKWRLNTGRQKIRNRIGENSMDKVYSRINWNTTCCNGSMDSNRYLSTQIARAICKAVYEKPLTIEEISISTGIPAMYIEDDLPRLEYGDAICKIGNNKYATNFIVFGLEDRKYTEGVSEPLVKAISDKFEHMLHDKASTVSLLDFYGHDFGLDRLGFMLIPYILRRKIGILKSSRLKLDNGPFPTRKDGGYGWFIVEETLDENEFCAEYNAGCNIASDDNGRKSEQLSHIYYYWISKYFDSDIYHNTGTRWLCENNILQNCKNGMVDKEALSEEDAAKLIQNNLISKTENGYILSFACFSEEQYEKFISLFDTEDEYLDNLLSDWIVTVSKNFAKFVPARLDDQINQWVSGYLFHIVGYVVDELIRRGTLRKPDLDKPLTDGVFYVAGKYINP